MTREEQFLQELPVIERVVGWVCSRRNLRGADADDFRQIVMTRLVESDYDVFAKFQGRSSLKTYLTAVVNRMYLDFQVQRFGKWRHSAAARRLGQVAKRLECLIYRDGLSLDEACGVLLSDPRLGVTRDELYAMSQRIPPRKPRQARAEEFVPQAHEDGASAVARGERQALAERSLAVIRRTLAQFPARDRMFFRMVFESDVSVADAARALRVEQKRLYRTRESALAQLKAEFLREGITAEDVEELLSKHDWDAVLGLDDPGPQPPEPPGSRPSQGHGDAAFREGGQ
jgi:RNA polymerase sigma factor (sigma-70 family)